MVIEDGDWLSGTRHGYVSPPQVTARMAAAVLARPLVDYQH
jgi:hypothetical protein